MSIKDLFEKNQEATQILNSDSRKDMLKKRSKIKKDLFHRLILVIQKILLDLAWLRNIINKRL